MTLGRGGFFRRETDVTPNETLLAQDTGIDGALLAAWARAARVNVDRAAFCSPGTIHTYRQADELSDRVAVGLLASAEDAIGEPVALFCDHTADALVGLLGIMKAGRIVVVLDPHLPAGRLQQIVQLAAARTFVVDAAHASAFGDLGGPLSTPLLLEDLLEAAASEPFDEGGKLPGVDRKGADPVAIVFTSGSTGQPKGVVQTHGQLLNDVLAHREQFRLTTDDRVALVLPYGFAAGLSLFFGAVLNGAGVWSYDPRDGGTRGLVRWIQDNDLTTLHCTPHLLRSVTGALPANALLESVRVVSTVGEAVHGSDVEGIRAHLADSCAFVNWTGSSEIGVLSFYEVPGGADVPPSSLPAGQVVANRDVRIVLEDGTPAAPGDAGEIEVVSEYLSGGYWKDPQSTAARFRVDPDGRAVCRQGDLGRFDANGDLVLMGRGDGVVKVRGYLVDPSEIESAFLAIPGVKEIAVIPVTTPAAPTRLVAYVVPHAHLRTPSTAALRRDLRERLPEYMVPTQIVQLAELPRNERGKVDRPLLPEAAPTLITAHPTTQWELIVASIWSEVLGLDAIGLDDDFMALGGDSLSAEEMLTIVHEQTGVALMSTDLIQAPTLQEFTTRVTHGSSSLPNHPDVIALQTGSGRPLFFFAGSGALALTFLPLSRYFPDHSVYAFQAHGLERRGIPDWTVEAAARRFLELIRVIQPRGPYVLLGHSFGGLIALEVARMLTEADGQVELLGLLDTYMPHRVVQQPMSTFERIPERPARQTLRQAAARRYSAQIGRLLPDGLPPLRQLTKQSRAYLAGVVPFAGQRQFDAFFDHGVITGRRYKLPSLDIPVLLVLADNNPDGIDAWRAVLTGTITALTVACEHSSLLRQPHVARLSESLRAELQRTST